MAKLIFTKMENKVPGGASIDSQTLLTAKMLEDDGSLSYDNLKAVGAAHGLNHAQLKNLLKNIDGFQWTANAVDTVTPSSSGEIVSFNLKTSGAVGGNEA